MRKITLFWILSISFVLASCSLSKDISFLKTNKLQAKQELIKQNDAKAPHSTNAPIQVLENSFIKTKIAGKTSGDSIDRNEVSIKYPLHKRTADTKLDKKTGQVFALLIIKNSVHNLLKKQVYSAQIGRTHLSDDDYKKLWITLLTIAIICFILAFIFDLLFLSEIGDILDILGIIAGIPGIIFLVLWLLDTL